MLPQVVEAVVLAQVRERGIGRRILHHARVLQHEIEVEPAARTIVGTVDDGRLVDIERGLLLGGGQRRRVDDRAVIRERGGNPIAMLAMALLAPFAAMLIQLAITRTREYDADAGGAAIAGNPLALASAATTELSTPPDMATTMRRPAAPPASWKSAKSVTVAR